MGSRIGVTAHRQLIWADAVIEIRQGTRWLVIPPGRVVWAPRRFAVWAVHAGAALHRVTLSAETAERLPKHLAAYDASDVLKALLPLVDRHSPGHPRRTLDEQVIVDEVRTSVRQEHGLFIEGFLPGLGWGTTLGIADAHGVLSAQVAAGLAMTAAREAAPRSDWLLRVRLALILRAHQHTESLIRDALSLFTSRHLDRILADEFD